MTFEETMKISFSTPASGFTVGAQDVEVTSVQFLLSASIVERRRCGGSVAVPSFRMAIESGAHPLSMNTKLTVVGLAVVLLCSCNKEHSATANKSSSQPTFDHASFLEITPMLDGSAYATALDSRLWYLRGNKAVRVTVLGDASQQLPRISEITPVLDGSAYATCLDSDPGLWYLHAEHIEKVSEVASLADSGTPPQISDKAFYALYLSEHKKRKEAEDVLNNPPESSDDSYDPY